MPTQPNLLLLFTDQHNAETGLGCAGGPHARTPHLDRLAAEGMRFSEAYTACPICTPTRATVMTGQYPHRHGLTCNSDVDGNIAASIHELPLTDDLWSRRMERAGYALGYSGKWHLGVGEDRVFGDRPNRPVLPRDCGWEGQQFPGHGSGGWAYDEYRAYLVSRGWALRLRRDSQAARGAGILDLPDEAHVESWLADHTISLIERFQAEGRPWCIWHNAWGPHTPCYVPPAWYERFAGLSIEPWDSFGAQPHDAYTAKSAAFTSDWESWQTYLRYYYAFIAFIDAQVGRIVEHLRERGWLDDTLVVHSADHGEYQGHYRGLGDKIYGHHRCIQQVPFILRPPASVSGPRGRVCDRPVSHVDLLPTFLDAAGQAADPGLPGRSLLDLWRGRDQGWRTHVGTETFGSHLPTTQITLRNADWTYGFNAGGTDELYDRRADRDETVNRVDDPACAAALAGMREAMGAWMEETHVHPHGQRAFRALRLGGRSAVGQH